MKVEQIARYITAKRKNNEISERTLNYLIYYSAKKYYEETGKPLFEEDIRKEEGKTYPVCGDFPKASGIVRFDDMPVSIPEKAKSIIDAVCEKYARYTTSMFYQEFKREEGFAKAKTKINF